MRLVLSIVAYDYQVHILYLWNYEKYIFLLLDVWIFTLFISDLQEIAVLVTLFCLFHACVGLILPSLAKLRTMYAKLSVLSHNFRRVSCKFCYAFFVVPRFCGLNPTILPMKKKKSYVDLFFKFSAVNCVYRYVPNELRGGMISLSLAPANAAILLFLIQVCSSLSLSLSLSLSQ